MLMAEFTISPEHLAEFTAPSVVVTEGAATAIPSSHFLLRHLINGTAQHQSMLDAGSRSLLSAADILEASLSLGIDEDHESYAAGILRESRLPLNAVKL